MIFYFISRLIIIGSLNRYENIFKDSDSNIIEESFFLSTTFLVSFIAFITILFLVYILKSLNKEKYKIYVLENNTNNGLMKYLSNTLLRLIFKYNSNYIGILIILLPNTIEGFIHSLSVLFIDEPDKFFHSNNSEKYYLYFAISINANFIFLINYYCLIIAKNPNDFEKLFSQTMIISLYFIICDILIYFIKLVLINEYNLFILQFAISSFSLILFIIITLRWFFFCSFSCIESCQYIDGKFFFNCCCCNSESICHNDCCNYYCSECNCSYICCEPCCNKINNLS